MCAGGLRGARFVAELAVAVDVRDYRLLLYPFLKCCDANCYELASYGTRCEMKCSSAV